MSDKIRLDVAVFERGYAETREKAKALIMAGSVYVNGQKALKGGAYAWFCSSFHPPEFPFLELS